MALQDVLFRELRADDLPEVTEIESVCMNCLQNGVTKLLLTKIPFFHDVILASFKCEECGYDNVTVDTAGPCQLKGVIFTLEVANENDMNRRILLSKGSILSIPDLDSEFPISVGSYTTIEGALMNIIENINHMQEERREKTPDTALQLDKFVEKFQNMINLKQFTIKLTDMSGNSVIENFMSPKVDPQLSTQYYSRTVEENDAIGFNEESVDSFTQSNVVDSSSQSNEIYADTVREKFQCIDEVMHVSVNCPKCNVPIECKMKVVDIPYFKEVILMASECDFCDHRENEVIGGCGISEKGRRITLKIEEKIDLSRDLLKNNDTIITIPEIDTELSIYSLVSRFTTVEGILLNIADKMLEVNPFLLGDSATKSTYETSLRNTISKVRAIAKGDLLGVSLILQDPTGNCYIQDLYKPDLDPRLKVEDYDRSEEENSDMGLLDMKVVDY